MPRVHLQGKKAVATIDGDPMAVEDGSYTVTSGVDEITNLLSQGFYEDLDTVKSATASLRLVYDGDAPPTFTEGQVVPLSITVPGVAAVTGPPAVAAVPGGPALGGNFRIRSMTFPTVTPKGSVRYTLDMGSTGPYTTGQSATPP